MLACKHLFLWVFSYGEAAQRGKPQVLRAVALRSSEKESVMLACKYFGSGFFSYGEAAAFPGIFTG